MSILVLGATGLLGNAVFRVLFEAGDRPVFGTTRNAETRQFFIPELANQLVVVEDLEDITQITELFEKLRPTVVVNCTALGKDNWQDPMKMMSMFAVLPRRLAHLCRSRQVRLVQISSDGVFSGKRGNYTEDDLADANDPYGIAKFLGEVDGPGIITLRTSIIGPEIISKNGLLEWFLLQQSNCPGYTNVTFSGFPTIVLAQIIRDVVLPRPKLEGVYHIASSPISKFDLLHLIAQRYNRPIQIEPDDSLVIDRSLSADRFTQATGYVAPTWTKLIDAMYSYKFGIKGT